MIIKRNQVQNETSIPNETILRVQQLMDKKPKSLQQKSNIHGILPTGISKC